MKRNEYIEVGCMAMRDKKTGEFLPSIPLYIKNEDGAEEARETLIKDAAKLFAELMRKENSRLNAASAAV